MGICRVQKFGDAGILHLRTGAWKIPINRTLHASVMTLNLVVLGQTIRAQLHNIIVTVSRTVPGIFNNFGHKSYFFQHV